MKNPWTRKNPFLSMWLSGANAIAGSVRGHATAHVKRQMAAAVAQITNKLYGLTPVKPRRRRRK